jgi:hypothetical protein
VLFLFDNYERAR